MCAYGDTEKKDSELNDEVSYEKNESKNLKEVKEEHASKSKSEHLKIREGNSWDSRLKPIKSKNYETSIVKL